MLLWKGKLHSLGWVLPLLTLRINSVMAETNNLNSCVNSNERRNDMISVVCNLDVTDKKGDAMYSQFEVKSGKQSDINRFMCCSGNP